MTLLAWLAVVVAYAGLSLLTLMKLARDRKRREAIHQAAADENERAFVLAMHNRQPHPHDKPEPRLG